MTASNEAERRIEEAFRSGAWTLDLHGLRLRTVPDSILRLTQLEELHLSLNELTDLPASLATLVNLKRLYLSLNDLERLPETLGALPHLQVLDVAHNRLTALPAGMASLASLRVLNLADNAFTAFPALLGSLPSLQELNFSNNRLAVLPAAARSLGRLHRLFLHGNPGLQLPPEVLGPTHEQVWRDDAVAASPKSALEFYFDIRENRPLNEAKMILVGRGGVGKTSLVRRLVHNTFSTNQRKTEGIAITPWAIAGGGDSVRINIWDFGGQEIMHATHQIFMTKRSLYLFVINAREGEQEQNIDYWLRLIESFGAQSPIIVVVNKIRDHHFELNRRGLQAKFRSIRLFVETDCAAGIGMEELKRAIAMELNKLPHVRDPFPADWFSIKDRLSNLQENYISFAQYQAICAERGVVDHAEQERLVGFLHDLGIVVNFREHAHLRDTHVLNPRWVTEGIYRILNHPAFAARKTGGICVADLAGVLDATRYPAEKHQYILDLMKQFELCYEFYDKPGHYLIPELLTKEEPPLEEFADPQATHFRYHYDVLPEGILPRFIVRARVLNQGLARWRAGVQVKFDGARALIAADAEERCVNIAVLGEGSRRRRLLSIIRSDFEKIHRSIPNLSVAEEIVYKGVALSYAELRALERKSASFERLIGTELETINAKVLLGDVDESPLQLRSLAPGDSVRQRLCVALSYSHKDERFRDELEKHLTFLERAGLIRIWCDRKIVAGERWQGLIDANFERADVILLLVSADFIASDYCHEIEMKTALRRHYSGEATVVPVVLRPCKWMQTPLGHLQALPKGGKPVTKWTNRDEAWTSVADGIERIVSVANCREAK